jgi:hypothetical protein
MNTYGIDNVYTLLAILALVAFGYYYFFVRSSKEGLEIPAPAALQQAPQVIQVPRQISASGPNPPNAKISNVEARKNEVYGVVANDLQDEKYGSQDIQDNLRYPERSFGPGMVNEGTKILANSGVATNTMLDSKQALQSFSPEMVQNGAVYDGVAPNDTGSDPNYASF